MTKMQARMEFVPIDHLAMYADKKVCVRVGVGGVCVWKVTIGSVCPHPPFGV